MQSVKTLQEAIKKCRGLSAYSKIILEHYLSHVLCHSYEICANPVIVFNNQNPVFFSINTNKNIQNAA